MLPQRFRCQRQRPRFKDSERHSIATVTSGDRSGQGLFDRFISSRRTAVIVVEQSSEALPPFNLAGCGRIKGAGTESVEQALVITSRVVIEARRREAARN